MATEIRNFICSSCGEPIAQDDFEASVALLKDGIVTMTCPKCQVIAGRNLNRNPFAEVQDDDRL